MGDNAAPHGTSPLLFLTPAHTKLPSSGFLSPSVRWSKNLDGAYEERGAGAVGSASSLGIIPNESCALKHILPPPP